MSLINEALKKAQNQRKVALTDAPSNGSEISATGGQTLVRITKRPPPLSARTLIVLFGGGVFGLLGLGVVSYFYFTAHVAQTVDVAANPHLAAPGPPAAPATAKPPLAGVPKPDLPVPTQPIISVSLPPIPGSPVSSASPDPLFTPPPPPPPRPPAAPVANLKISEFVDALRISVVRLTPTDPKVVLNGQVFRINDMVDRGLKVRLVKIEASSLTFSDLTGFEYLKPY
jgi:hypothetical protein